jgi:hypothetical protein
MYRDSPDFLLGVLDDYKITFSGGNDLRTKDPKVAIELKNAASAS